jgi:hypothetical protein
LSPAFRQAALAMYFADMFAERNGKPTSTRLSANFRPLRRRTPRIIIRA